tara:strand:- start:389 stop:1393 length:1005 start_codon:yes stop_codon:yes gene_type:complete
MYLISFFTRFLHYLPSEISHIIALKGLKCFHALGFTKILEKNFHSVEDCNERDLRYLSKKIGIAAGLDKNGDYIDCLASLGVDFIEVGTVTPRAQKGNPKPRIFRNLKEKSLLNRLGFNNKGVDYLLDRLKEKKSDIIVGSSIGKNFNTPNEDAHKDYIFCLEKIYEFSDYIAINISSPNTQGLRKLGSTEYLDTLLAKIKTRQNELSTFHGYKPIFVKLSPDETPENLDKICDSIILNKIDGIISSNTTVDHDDKNSPGGLSGLPLKEKATDNLRYIRKYVGDELPIIASGGVMSASDFQEKISAGASSVQIYTGFIYEGPKLIREIINSNSI